MHTFLQVRSNGDHAHVKYKLLKCFEIKYAMSRINVVNNGIRHV